MLPSHVVTAARRLRLTDLRRVGRGAWPQRERTQGERTQGERGAVLVHAAVAMTGLLAFSALTIDLGTVWVARGQAQNAVDAAALAGAISLAYGDPTNPDAAVASARVIGQTHQIWGEAVSASQMTVTAGGCPTGSPGVTGDCLSVAVERGGGAGSPLPAFFSRLFGAAPTRLRASASAKVMLGNSSPCVQPIAIPDRWIEFSGPWTYASQFQRYQPGRPGVLIPNPDSYVAPDAGSAGTGHLVSEMLGQALVLRRGQIDTPAVLGDNYYSLDLPRVGGEGLDQDTRYDQNMTGCAGVPMSIGDTVYTMVAHQTRTEPDINQRYNQDPGATWDGSKVVGSAYGVSPRIIQMVLYDPDQFSQVPNPVPEPYRVPMVVRNIVGFFITEPMDGSTIAGVVVTATGNFNQSVPPITQDAAFLRSVALVR